MIINFMKDNALDMLKSDIPNNVFLYNSKDKWIDSYFEEKGLSNYSFNTGMMIPDVELLIGDSKTDCENAIRIYEAFKGRLNPVQASDLRLWAFLAHNVYWDYMRERWGIDVAFEDDENDAGKDKIVSRIGTRYFYEASKGKAFVRQGIARLYWSAYLTYDESNVNNPYELTEYFLSKQDIFAVSTERSLARNKELLLAALKVLKEHGDLKRNVIRQYFLNLNQAGGVIVLDSLSKELAYDLAKSTLDNVVLEMEFREKNDDNSGKDINSINRKVVKRNSKIVVMNLKTQRVMPIAVDKNKLQTKPKLEGLFIGAKFKISKDIWQVTEIK
ncbi:DUF6339 family protein [Lacrimispora sp. BS-2]|uniref:DUF6339 family protein n=1 Tax=Lacrimispora sp. BS-2 TaxID=3151850 RepID=A0AAU7PTN6_9FIRM